MSSAIDITRIQASVDRIVQSIQSTTLSADRIYHTLENRLGIATNSIYLDHLAFRSFNTSGLGIESISSYFNQLGYIQQSDILYFPNKKLKAVWLAPPNSDLYEILPRIFISEINVNDLSEKSQNIINSYVNDTEYSFELIHDHQSRPWCKSIDYNDYLSLKSESDYAAWVLVHRYSLNHFALSWHRMIKSTCSESDKEVTDYVDVSSLPSFIDALINQGYQMSYEGGLVKVSPDGLLLQASTLSDLIEVTFSDGITRTIPGSYVEFVERKVLYEYKDSALIKEIHRRDGFETSNADSIFESTNLKKQVN